MESLYSTNLTTAANPPNYKAQLLPSPSEAYKSDDTAIHWKINWEIRSFRFIGNLIEKLGALVSLKT
jgi:hypothetical protein